MNNFASSHRGVAPSYKGYAQGPSLNAGLRILSAEQRSTARAIAHFPEHAATVVSALEPFQASPHFDKALADILKIARKTCSFKCH